MKVNIGPYKDDSSDRDIDIRIDNYDVWNLDHTLALIILPALKKFEKQGAPVVDSEDVPEELRADEEELKTYKNGEVDDNFFKRWDCVLEEMIFAFDFLANDRESELINKLYTDEELEKPLEESLNSTAKKDYSEARAAEERAQNGFRLFGKYYMNLWD